MPKLVPLKQWICDYCGEVIRQPEHGWLEWTREDRKSHDFKIVHHLVHSPHAGTRPEGCYFPTHRPGSHLTSFVGDDGHSYLIAFLDAGYVDPEDSGPQVESTRELANLMRRLTIPNYEEARKYWTDAVQAGFFAGANEVSPYTQQSLLELIEQYGKDPDA